MTQRSRPGIQDGVSHLMNKEVLLYCYINKFLFGSYVFTPNTPAKFGDKALIGVQIVGVSRCYLDAGSRTWQTRKRALNFGKRCFYFGKIIVSELIFLGKGFQNFFFFAHPQAIASKCRSNLQICAMNEILNIKRAMKK